MGGRSLAEDEDEEEEEDSMSTLLRKRASKVGIAVLGGLCLAAGVAAATAPSSRAGTQAFGPPVDHQLCYTAYGPYFHVPTRVVLLNQFVPNGFQPKITTTVALHCNPVAKFTQAGAFGVTNPDAHLACYRMTANPQATHKVVVANQFGQAVLQTGQPNQFCVPSWKGLNGPPRKSPRTPPGLNHFTCYPVTPIDGAYQPPPIQLLDQFSKTPVPAQVDPVPVKLCLPTEKFLPATNKDFPIINPDLHLLCYPVTPTPKKTPVYDENQFGTAKITIKLTKLLCLPSTKQVIQ